MDLEVPGEDVGDTAEAAGLLIVAVGHMGRGVGEGALFRAELRGNAGHQRLGAADLRQHAVQIVEHHGRAQHRALPQQQGTGVPRVAVGGEIAVEFVQITDEMGAVVDDELVEDVLQEGVGIAEAMFLVALDEEAVHGVQI